MKRFFTLAILALLAMSWTTMEARWVLGERKSASEIKAGDTVAIRFAGSEAFADCYLQAADDQNASLGVMVAPGMGVGASAVITFEQGPADMRTGAPTFYMKLVGSNKYIGNHNYDWYNVGQGAETSIDKAGNFQILSCGEEIPWYDETRTDNFTKWTKNDDAVWDDKSVGFSISPSSTDFAYLAYWGSYAKSAPRAITWKYTNTIEWNVYGVSYEKDLKEDLEALINSYTSGNDYVGGDNPGCYATAKVEAFNTSLQAAMDVLYGGDLPDKDVQDAIDELKRAHDEMFASEVPITEGYYYIICDNANIAANDKPQKAMYLNEIANSVYWGEFDAKDIKFVFHLTPNGEKSWNVQGLKSGMYFGPVAGFVKPFTLSDKRDYPATFHFYTGTGSAYIKTNDWTMCPHNNASGLVDGPYDVWSYNGEGTSGGNVPHAEWTWTLQKITDQTVLDGFLNEKVQCDRTATLEALTNEANTLYRNLFAYTVDKANGLIQRASGGAGTEPSEDAQISFSTIRRQGIATADSYAFLIDGDSVSYMQGSGYITIKLDEPRQLINFEYKTRGGSEQQQGWGFDERPKLVDIYGANTQEGDTISGTPIFSNIDMSAVVGNTSSVNLDMGRPVDNIVYKVVSNYGGSSYFTLSEFQLYPTVVDESNSQYNVTPGMKEAADALANLIADQAESIASNTVTEAQIADMKAALAGVRTLYADTAGLKALLKECNGYLDNIELGDEVGQLSDEELLANLTLAVIDAEENAFRTPISLNAVKEATKAVTDARDALLAGIKSFEVGKWYFITNLDNMRSGEDGTADARCYGNAIYMPKKYSSSACVKWGLYDIASQTLNADNNPKAMWRFVPVEGTTDYAIQNLYTGYYLGDFAGADINIPVSETPVPYSVVYSGKSQFTMTPNTDKNSKKYALYAEGNEKDVVCHEALANSASSWTFKEVVPEEQEAISIPDFAYNLIDVMTVPYDVSNLSEYNQDVHTYAVKKITQEENAEGVLVSTIEFYEKNEVKAGEPVLIVLGDTAQAVDCEPYDMIIPFPTSIVDHTVTVGGNGLVGALHSLGCDAGTAISNGKYFYAVEKSGSGFDAQTGVIDPTTYKGEVTGVETAYTLVVKGLSPIPAAGRIGDVNEDGSVNGADVVAIYNYIQAGESSNVKRECADVDGDGNVNGADVVATYNAIVGAAANSSRFKAQAKRFLK